MTDALIADLSRIRSVRVISRTSAMHYKQRTKTLPEIAQELNVDAVVEGSVMRFGNRVRITAELIEARQDRHLWADTYERDLDDILKLQKELAEAIARQVRVQLNLPQQARLASVSGVDPKAYEAFAKGRFYLTTNSNTPQGIKQALSYFEHAVQKDSDFALAYVGLADCYQFLGGFRRMPPRDAYQRAKEAIDKALLLDATLARPTLPWAR
jgi:adenylate cyclase